jgi:hypothetical protein
LRSGSGATGGFLRVASAGEQSIVENESDLNESGDLEKALVWRPAG